MISIFLCGLVDAVLFHAVDRIALWYINNASGINEKRDIWFRESVALLGIALLVFVLHHTPIILICYSVLTFFSSTNNGYDSLLHYWENLQAYWRDFIDQEESMKEMHRLNVFQQQQQQPVYKNQVTPDQYKDYMRQSGEVVISNQNSVSTESLNQGLRHLRYNETKAKYEYVPPQPNNQPAPNPPQRISKLQLSQPTQNQPAQLQVSQQPDLRRRPISASNIVTQVEPEPQQKPDNASVFSTIGNKIFDAVKWSNRSLDLPPGLSNPGRNLCFMNSVLQCLSRAPNLADELNDVSKTVQCEDTSRLSLICNTAEVLQQLDVVPSENNIRVVDSDDFKMAAAEVGPQLLSPKSASQHQQDSCEFYTWILTELHEIINNSKVNGNRKSEADKSLKKLKQIYGNVSENYAEQMKLECRSQISECKKGLSDDALVEPIQNLANLEWVSHKRKNCSIIDDLFTSQSISLQMCTNCCSISTNIQTFNVLSLPVPTDNKPTSVQKILKSYTAQEKLWGNDQIQCDTCEKQSLPQNLATPMIIKPKSAAAGRRSLESLSPISGENGHVKHLSVPSSQHASSTPILPHVSARIPKIASVKPVMTDGVKQYFLRRLSECVTIQLMRYNYNPFTKKVSKVTTPIEITLNNLDMSDVVYDKQVEREDMADIDKDCIYNLFGICVHTGGTTTSSGHYFAYCMAADGQWYKFDDEHVMKIANMEKESLISQIQENSYILFYRKHCSTN